MNVITFVGRLAKDAEVRVTTSGLSILSFTVANDAGFGQRKTTNWFNCSIIGKRAEGELGKYLTKGQQVVVSGEFVLREYDKKDGTKGYSSDVNVNELELVGKKNEQQQENHQAPHQDDLGSDSFDDDIPF